MLWLVEHEEALAAYPVSFDERLWTVKVNGQELPCQNFGWMD